MTALGIDYGTKRIGLAITDELEIIASPLKVIPNDAKTLAEIKGLVAQRKIDTVVVGLPLKMDGSVGPAAEAATRFAEALQKEVNATVQTFDERLTTAQAERAMLRHDVSRTRRARRRDQMAAQFLLQSFIDSKKR